MTRRWVGWRVGVAAGIVTFYVLFQLGVGFVLDVLIALGVGVVGGRRLARGRKAVG